MTKTKVTTQKVRTLQAAPDRAQDLREPQHIDLLGEQLYCVEAALLQQIGRMHV